MNRRDLRMMQKRRLFDQMSVFRILQKRRVDRFPDPAAHLCRRRGGKRYDQHTVDLYRMHRI